MKTEQLYVSVVGSHAWGMERPDSDWDYHMIFLNPTRDMLVGHYRPTGKMKQGRMPTSAILMKEADYDIHFHEVGHHIHQLQKGNINHVVCLFSPSVETYFKADFIVDNTVKQALQKIYKENISKNIFDSINGMTSGNLKKYFTPGKASFLNPERGGDVMAVRAKKLNQILRLVIYGFQVLKDGDTQLMDIYPHMDVSFMDVAGSLTHEGYVRQWQLDLQKAYDASPLPAEPDPQPYEDFLLRLRLNHMTEMEGVDYHDDVGWMF